jgi:hypothetical protein
MLSDRDFDGVIELCEPEILPVINKETVMKSIGTREEVWAGIATRTGGRLTKADLMLNKKGAIVSIKQSNSAKVRYPELKAKMCGAPLPTIVLKPEPKVEPAPKPKVEPAPKVETKAEPVEEKIAPTLVYFGAGWDMLPLNMKDYSKFAKYLFIDALPKLSHYNPDQSGYEFTKDEDSYIRKLKVEASKKGYKFINRLGDVLTFTKGDKTLEYHINTTVQEAIDDPYLSKQLRYAKFIHIKGFSPMEFGLKISRDMPNMFKNLAELREKM